MLGSFLAEGCCGRAARGAGGVGGGCEMGRGNDSSAPYGRRLLLSKASDLTPKLFECTLLFRFRQRTLQLLTGIDLFMTALSD